MSVDATRWAWMQQGLRPGEKLILLSLADRAGEDMTCFPSKKRLHDDTGLDRKTIIASLETLVQKGLIKDTGKRCGKTGQIRVFQLIGIPVREDSEKGPEKGTVSYDKGTENGTLKNDKGSQKRDGLEGERVPFFPSKGPKNGTRNLSRNLPEKRTDQSFAHRRDAEREFAQFWAAYPRKKSKGQARKTWDKISKAKELPDLSVLLAAIAAAKAGHDWQQADGKYIPYPSTWLNDQGWEDEQGTPGGVLKKQSGRCPEWL